LNGSMNSSSYSMIVIPKSAAEKRLAEGSYDSSEPKEARAESESDRT
jgi:hypothetical protein